MYETTKPARDEILKWKRLDLGRRIGNNILEVARRHYNGA